MDKQRVLVTHAIPREGLADLFGRFEVIYPEGKVAFSVDELRDILPSCAGVLACGAIDGDLIERADRLSIISNYGAGYDRIDVAAADRRGIIVTNIPDSTTESTAELAFALLIDVYRRIAELDRKLRCEPPENTFGMGRNMAHNLRGSVLGIVGMGRIGRRLADMARAFGMEIIYFNRHQLSPDEEKGARWRPLDELLAHSDAVSVNCPLTDETRGLISRDRLALMKSSAVIINTSRGGTIDYEALADALEAGRLRGAGLDVFPDEPHVPPRLRALDQVTLTPHVGTNTFEARTAMAEAAARRIIDALEGREPDNIVSHSRRKILCATD